MSATPAQMRLSATRFLHLTSCFCFKRLPSVFVVIVLPFPTLTSAGAGEKRSDHGLLRKILLIAFSISNRFGVPGSSSLLINMQNPNVAVLTSFIVVGADTRTE